jgi:hypothetical protein
MKPHKWAKEIKAWADGAEIEQKIGETWHQVLTPGWTRDTEYRIKPQPKEPQYLYAYQGKNQVWFSRHNHSDELNNCIGKIKLEVNDD